VCVCVCVSEFQGQRDTFYRHVCIASSPSTYKLEKVMSNYRGFKLLPATRTLPFSPEKKERYGNADTSMRRPV